MKIKDLLVGDLSKQVVSISGWVRTKRGSKNVSFIAINDGSTINNIQVVAEGINFKEDVLKQITTGSSVRVKGKLVVSKGKEQKVLIQQ